MATTTTSGLTRRRGAGGGGAGSGTGSGADEERRATPSIGPPITSYENGENGHRIAYDPHDISESAERSKQPKLTLMEEVLLLGLKDKQVCFCPVLLLRLNHRTMLTRAGLPLFLE